MQSSEGPALPNAEQGEACQPTSGRRQKYSDEFMMYQFKVEMCKRIDKHDREQCPYAHPGELARRRHPSLYQALPCPEARAKKICPRLENCNCSHSTFEFWLHPDRYKTFLCERGANCDRPICFFAHAEEELRELPQGLQRTQAAHRPSSSAAATSSSSRARGASSSEQQQARASTSAQAGCGIPPGAQQQPAAAGFWAAHPTARGGFLAGAGASMQQQQVFPGMGWPGPGSQVQVMFTPAGAPAGVPALPDGPSPDAPQHQHQQLHLTTLQPGLLLPVPGVPHPSMMVGYPMVPLGTGAAAAQPATAATRPNPPHRGITVAVIPAGPSTWQGSVWETDPGEAPSLETLCAAVARMALPQQDDSASQTQLAQQFQQPVGVGQQQQQSAHAGAQMPALQITAIPQYSMMQPVQVLTPQQHQQPPPPQQQQLLSGGQMMLVQAPPGEQGTEGAAAPWGSMQPGL